MIAVTKVFSSFYSGGYNMKNTYMNTNTQPHKHTQAHTQAHAYTHKERKKKKQNLPIKMTIFGSKGKKKDMEQNQTSMCQRWESFKYQDQ